MSERVTRMVEYLRSIIREATGEELNYLHSSLAEILGEISISQTKAAPSTISVPHTPVDPNRLPYKKMGEVLRAMFTAEGLMRWAESRWPKTRTMWGMKYDLDDVIYELLGHCARNMSWDTLIFEVSKEAESRGIVVTQDSGYNLSAVRALLTNAFSVGDLRRELYYSTTFRPALDGVPESVGLSGLVQYIVEWAEQRDGIDALLGFVEMKNPRQYANYKGSLGV